MIWYIGGEQGSGVGIDIHRRQVGLVGGSLVSDGRIGRSVMIWCIEGVVGQALVAVYLSWGVLCPLFREMFGVSIRPIAPIRPIGLTATHLLALLHLLALG